MQIINNAIITCALSLGVGCAAPQGPQANKQAAAANTTAATTPGAATPRPTAQTPVVSPDELVATLYKQAEKGQSPFFQAEDRARVDRYFEKGTADLIWKDAVESKGEVGALGVDPLYNAQDVELKNFKVHPAQINGAAAEVKVSFENFGKKEDVIYSLVLKDGSWKIADIRYGGGSTLVGTLKGAKP